MGAVIARLWPVRLPAACGALCWRPYALLFDLIKRCAHNAAVRWLSAEHKTDSRAKMLRFLHDTVEPETNDYSAASGHCLNFRRSLLLDAFFGLFVFRHSVSRVFVSAELCVCARLFHRLHRNGLTRQLDMY